MTSDRPKTLPRSLAKRDPSSYTFTMARLQSLAPKSLARDEEKKDDDVAGIRAKGRGRREEFKANLTASPASVGLQQPLALAAVSSASTFSRPRRRLLIIFGSLLHLLLLDCPVLISFTGYYATFLVERYYTDYLSPQMDLQLITEDRKSRELTYYHRTCMAKDLSATDTPELLIDYDTMTTNDAMYHMLTHGVSVYPNILSPETAAQVRDFILRQNDKNEDMISVIENDRRWSFGVKVDQDASIPKALSEILSHDFLVVSLERIMGPNPAIIEFTGITSAYGAKMQRYHADVVPEGSAAKWGRTFIPSYSLFIPLQNITGAMGATEICPGSHMCADGVFDYCPQHGFQVSGSSDNWPLGAGALLNQQLMHRGQAHSDPKGPPRVLFIVTFAPRPRFGDYQVETRSIAQGGSYSLHWQQWGHTLRDFANAPKYMGMLWRLLRSMGLYKPRSRQWGWDYITAACARISNSEVGFFHYELLEMLDKDQFNLLPKHLHGDIPPESDQSREIWVPFYLSTLHKCREALRSIHIAAVAAYFVMAIASCLIFSRHRVRGVFTSFGRLLMVHLTVYLVGQLISTRIAESTYAKNQRSSRSFQLPSSPSSAHAPDFPGTLPTETDVLVDDDMQSEYLASYTEVLDAIHPGNKAWFRTMRYYALGYENLTPQFQIDQCSMLIGWSLQQSSRILVKNQQNQWSVAPQDDAIRFCHKELLKTTNSYLRQVIRQLDFLLAETKFGYWRDSQMHRKVIPAYLRKLQDRIMRTPSDRPTKLLQQANVAFPLMPSLPSRPRNLSPSQRRVAERSNGIRSESSNTFSVGDDIEAAYASLRTEWYPAKIVGVDAHTMTWDVVYSDGEKESSLCLGCVRPFAPYQVEEDSVECRAPGEVVYTPCKVVAVGLNGIYKIQLLGSRAIEDFDVKGMRRVVYKSDGKFGIGDHVMAPYYSSGMFPGVVRNVYMDGTYAVRFDGDEIVPNIFGRLMVLQSEYDFVDEDDDDDYDDEEDDDDSNDDDDDDDDDNDD